MSEKVAAQVVDGITEIRMVEQIEDFDFELQFQPSIRT
jgi:hypothetical protein